MASVAEQPGQPRVRSVGGRPRYRLVAAVATLVCAGALAPATAASAATETVTCHEVITHSLTIANDLYCDGNSLTVGANNVTLDLGGHTVVGGETVGITSSGYGGVTIENGTVSADGPALNLASAHNDTVRNIQIRTHFESLTLTDGSQNTVVDSTISSASFGSVLMLKNEQGDVIRGNTFNLSGEGLGVLLDHSDSNQVIANTSHGQVLIAGNNNEVKFNSVTDVWGDGIDVEGTGNVLSGNVAFSNGDHPHPTPPGDGINVHTPGNVLIANTADDNGNYGIEAVPGVVDGGQNTASGNGNPAQCLNIVCSQAVPHVPASPSGLTATPANGAVTLSWQANAATDGVLHYNVYRTDQWFSGTSALASGTAYTDSFDVTNGTRYCYQITASNATGESARTAPVCATATAPPVPPAPSITGHPGSSSTQTTATFTFTDSQAGVQLKCSLDGGAFSDCSSPRRYDGLGRGQHTFQVRAVDSLGQASGAASYTWTVNGAVKGVGTKRVMTLGNIRDWVSAAVINRFYGGRKATKLTAFRVTRCTKLRSGRFHCDVSWRKAPYAFAGTVTVGSLNPSTGRFRSAFSLVRRNTLTGAKKLVNLAY